MCTRNQKSILISSNILFPRGVPRILLFPYHEHAFDLFPAAIHRIEACCLLVTKTPERFASVGASGVLVMIWSD